MSGGGGGGSDPGPGDNFDCAGLSETTILNSPVPAVLKNLKPRDVLSVDLHTQANRKSLRASDKSGAIAGSLTPISLPNIIKCIEAGWEFVAIVKELTGGRCVVTVRPKAA